MPRLARLLLATSLLASSLLSTACSTAPSTASRGPAAPAVVKADPWAQSSPNPGEWQEPAVDRGMVRAHLWERRERSIARFLRYRDAKVYPINTYAPGLQHVWRDETGRLCAAATLISYDWGRDAVGRVADRDNFIKLADVHDGALMDWMLTSGFTQHEIVAIQEPMSREPPGPKPDAITLKEIDRLFAIYTSVERQLRDLGDESLEEATDALMAHPDLARALLAGELPDAGEFSVASAPITEPTRAPAAPSGARGFSQPPPA